MKKLGMLVFVVAIVGSFAAVWAFTGKAVSVPSLTFFKQIKGSGNVVTEKRDVAGFSGVDASGAMQLEITVGKEFSVELEGDDNVLPLIETKVRSGILHFDRKANNIRTKSRLIARVSLPELNDLTVSGVSQATILNVDSESLKIEASGASKIEISGVAREINVDASGASELRAEKLRSERAKIEASGASKVEIFAAEAIDADASGASRINYAGNPKSVSKDSSGASRISAN